MKQYKWILPLIAIAGVVIALFFIIPAEDDVIDQIQKIEIEELKRENKTLIQTNELLDSKVEILESMADSLTVLINVDSRVLEKLKERKDEKVSAIDDFTDDELYQYFARFDTKSKGN
ncbi:hypothetical protein [Aquimarina algiphila]|uniref:Uncharacterized protein n=1 Tax=Aquimarina algiphila TaxID=2047982 RepID=A0A554VJ48_9FLAO|nr:hypothetical protein [Aquimarina algiphila]TSE07905.1 hypothetical protein FOF46_14360 [Aquimarina algiphila]